ncbi:MAG: acetyl-CoA carboxylase biotin carboxylase subunit [Candidatus Omnitrophica bacterium 4484_70.1]|nr:MAG: acetyl-CoA carboxylase biotin carboxylase subunit [Candidatus Omnitrophica bacterium 4484_70.1]
MFSKILVANRGEIAIRIIRTCKELGIKTVGVYSEADKNSLHLEFADEAICIGKGDPRDSYLNISSIISAAEITDSDAIHPGYGFLAENSYFAEVCESCGIKFIGPSSQSIRLMGDKINAKNSMRKAGLPLIPGSETTLPSKEEALRLAKKLGYPVILKAKAGGGGRGMRVCHSDVRLIGAFMTAQAEAEAAFGDPEIYMEKFLQEPRHIEVQVVSDNYGNTIYLGERDCSIQYRHQKLIEEAPSPAIDDKLRRKLGELAVKGAKAINYTNLGTMEFMVDKEGNFYFMEMNTRIQVEHPVTEEITNLDLIELQILISAGEKLKLKQEDIKFEGSAIECRINAQDPDNNLLPSIGNVDFCYLPGGRDVRVDTHLYGGYKIPPYYDSLLAKIITKGKNREEALRKMERGLSEFLVEPIKTTVPFCRKIICDPDFKKGNYHTKFLNRFLGEEEE